MSARPARTLADPEPPTRSHATRNDELFAPQPSSRNELPDPSVLITNLCRSVIEILAGARELEQIARWVSEDVFHHLLKRVILAERARRVRGETPVRPNIHLGPLHLSEPRDGVVEAVVLVHSRVRTRAVAIRLEGFDRRWRATSLAVL